jgi:tRNA-guanine family transglycosylase
MWLCKNNLTFYKSSKFTIFLYRTARFGCALVRNGQLNLKQSKYKFDLKPIDENCECSTCKTYSRTYLHHIVSEPAACSMITVHNVAFQLKLMDEMRTHITNDTFPEFVRKFMDEHFIEEKPKWIVDALKSVDIELN